MNINMNEQELLTAAECAAECYDFAEEAEVDDLNWKDMLAKRNEWRALTGVLIVQPQTKACESARRLYSDAAHELSKKLKR